MMKNTYEKYVLMKLLLKWNFNTIYDEYIIFAYTYFDYNDLSYRSWWSAHFTIA